MNHGIEDADSNIAQRYGTIRKRRLEETQMRSDNNSYIQDPVSLSSEVSLLAPLNYSMRPSNQYPASLPQDIAIKRMKIDGYPTSQPQYSSAINPAVSINFDHNISRPIEAGSSTVAAECGDGSGDLARACPVCTKMFPKPSDLKRHMMCHTGEKPFKCEVRASLFKRQKNQCIKIKFIEFHVPIC